jgi:iron-sulfur cluster repair protein YtfE (RIC family)
MSKPMRVRASTRDETTVSGIIGVAHDQMDAAIAEVRRALVDGEVEQASAGFVEIESELHHHINIEEQILFPLFDARTGVVGPSEVMLGEHRRIERWLARIRAALDGERVSEAEEALQQLVALLRLHHLKEEKILYPKTDAAMSAKERAELADWLGRELAPEAP